MTFLFVGRKDFFTNQWGKKFKSFICTQLIGLAKFNTSKIMVDQRNFPVGVFFDCASFIFPVFLRKFMARDYVNLTPKFHCRWDSWEDSHFPSQKLHVIDFYFFFFLSTALIQDLRFTLLWFKDLRDFSSQSQVLGFVMGPRRAKLRKRCLTIDGVYTLKQDSSWCCNVANISGNARLVASHLTHPPHHTRPNLTLIFLVLPHLPNLGIRSLGQSPRSSATDFNVRACDWAFVAIARVKRTIVPSHGGDDGLSVDPGSVQEPEERGRSGNGGSGRVPLAPKPSDRSQFFSISFFISPFRRETH
jgi:hypothetical protein